MNLIELIDQLTVGKDRIPFLTAKVAELQRDLFEASAAVKTLECEADMAAAMAVLEGREVTRPTKIDDAHEHLRGLQTAIMAVQLTLDDAQNEGGEKFGEKP